MLETFLNSLREKEHLPFVCVIHPNRMTGHSVHWIFGKEDSHHNRLWDLELACENPATNPRITARFRHSPLWKKERSGFFAPETHIWMVSSDPSPDSNRLPDSAPNRYSYFTSSPQKGLRRARELLDSELGIDFFDSVKTGHEDARPLKEHEALMIRRFLRDMLGQDKDLPNEPAKITHPQAKRNLDFHASALAVARTQVTQWLNSVS